MHGKRQPQLPVAKWRKLHAMLAAGKSHREIGHALKLSIATVSKYAGKLPPQPSQAPPRLCCPKSSANEYLPLQIDTPGRWLVLSDIHLPEHDRKTVEAAIRDAKAGRAAGVLLNGDVLDSHEISRHNKDPKAARYVEEIELCKQLFAWVRAELPRARIVYKAGNHEDRLEPYIFSRSPAIWGLEGLNLQSLLHLDEFGIEWVGDKRVIRLGKLPVIHGHEYPGGASSPIGPARSIYLKARSVVMCGHFHRTDMHRGRDVRGRPEAAWATGCACGLSPKYSPLNQWNLGYANVDVARDGSFEVDNHWRGERRVA